MPENAPTITEQQAYRDCAESLRSNAGDAKRIVDAVQRISNPILRSELLVPKR